VPSKNFISIETAWEPEGSAQWTPVFGQFVVEEERRSYDSIAADMGGSVFNASAPPASGWRHTPLTAVLPRGGGLFYHGTTALSFDITTKSVSRIGAPDPDHISTSYVERQNRTMRMHMRRFTRLTDGFSKKAENHAYAVALHFMYYNFCKIHLTIRTTPAMRAGVTQRMWEVVDLVRMIEEWENRATA
jgi:hypothetical protein